MDILFPDERIRESISLGESQFREFKSAIEGPASNKRNRAIKSIAKDIAETLVAFANADGGELFVGVEDDGSISGLSLNEEELDQLLRTWPSNIHSETPLNPRHSQAIKYQDKTILYLSIEKSVTELHQTSDGRCLQRRDRENRPVAATRITFERQEQRSREYDREFVEVATVSDLDLTAIRNVSNEITTGISPEKCLQHLGLAEYSQNRLHIRRAALLLFGMDVRRWHPRSQVRIVKINGTELKSGREHNSAVDSTVTGNVLQLLSNAWDTIRTQLLQIKMADSGGRFMEVAKYPEDACREALVNAITHRDYSVEGQGIEILIFDDRMEILSPGSLLSTLTLSDVRSLAGHHESRNVYIARTLREIGYVREMGEGMRRIYSSMQDADLTSPELRSDGGRFGIILRHKSVFSETDLLWLSGFKELRLTREEMKIALLGKKGHLLSAMDIYNMLKLVDWDLYRQTIEQAQAKGFIYSTQQTARRNTPRLRVRQPRECEQDVSDVFRAIGQSKRTTFISDEWLGELRRLLPPANFYANHNNLKMVRFLVLIGLIDNARHPTSILLNTWSAGASSQIESYPAPSDNSLSSGAGSAAAESNTARRKEDVSAPSETEGVELYVGNLDYSTTAQELSDFFSTFGDVESVRIPPDFLTGRGRGFAFVKMKSLEAAHNAFRMGNQEMFRGRLLRVNLADGRKRYSTRAVRHPFRPLPKYYGPKM